MSDAKIAYLDDRGIAVYRASAASKCLKALVLSRLGYEAMDPPDSMQLRFNDGHLHEPDILARVAAEGWEMHGAQHEVELPIGSGIIIRGHLDSLGVHPVHGLAVIEAKALSDSGYKKWLADQWAGFPYYAEQVSIYMAGTEADCLVFAVKNKNSGEVSITTFFEPPANLAKMKARIARAELLAKAGTIPECDKSDYPCPFFYLHDETPKEAPVAAVEADGTELGQLIDAYGAAKAVIGEMEAANKKVREQIIALLADAPAAATNRYRLTVSQSSRTKLDRKAIAAAGIDLAPYETTTRYPKVDVEAVAG